MSALVKFTPRVGVAPGTTTMQLGRTPLKCAFWGKRAYAAAREMTDAGWISGGPCLGSKYDPLGPYQRKTLDGPSYWNPYSDMVSLNEPLMPFEQLRRDRPIRWDLVAIIGGGSMLVALTAAFIASALRR